MNLSILSDLHFEFHADAGQSFVENLATDGVDVCVLAGDIAVGKRVFDALDLFCERFPHVVYVHGNHEFYGCARASLLEATRAAAARHPNLHWLDSSSAEIGGVRFIGAPLWFRANATAPKNYMADFSAIPDFESWVYAENARALTFLEAELCSADVVVTHHLPSQRSVSPQYERSPLNAFFVCDVEGLIKVRQPQLWVHGHTHDSLDYRLGRTRVVCNPFGYVPSELNGAFREDLRVDVTP